MHLYVLEIWSSKSSNVVLRPSMRFQFANCVRLGCRLTLFDESCFDSLHSPRADIEPTNRGALLLIVFDNVSCESRKPTNREAEKEALEKSLETAKAEARKILDVFVMPQS